MTTSVGSPPEQLDPLADFANDSSLLLEMFGPRPAAPQLGVKKRGALHFAAMRRPMIRGNDGDELACVSALLDAGFDVNEPDAHGEGG